MCLAISLHPKYAALVAAGKKKIEVRSRRIKYRGPLLIATTKLPRADGVPSGVALCLVNVIDCRPFEPDDAALACVEYVPDRWAWVLDSVEPVKQVAVKGSQGFYHVPDAMCESRD